MDVQSLQRRKGDKIAREYTKEHGVPNLGPFKGKQSLSNAEQEFDVQVQQVLNKIGNVDLTREDMHEIHKLITQFEAAKEVLAQTVRDRARLRSTRREFKRRKMTIWIFTIKTYLFSTKGWILFVHDVFFCTALILLVFC